ncbi:uncharacterized protein BJ171DRAFT_307314 [Polychytrium aggregatum]|uniref:uncharacterized protein n=1 Tax=Polychytrium aggregatum TaxID=110093 RepID=UPI0022FE84EB|nr:uncharacterized protein BJ171DRAFT_307314 [Polychytrium aggregatum]KAI9206820.1 hypothetical protein BJ171DRAFT_307314 [Polychytrium aggregatum]
MKTAWPLSPVTLPISASRTDPTISRALHQRKQPAKTASLSTFHFEGPPGHDDSEGLAASLLTLPLNRHCLCRHHTLASHSRSCRLSSAAGLRMNACPCRGPDALPRTSADDLSVYATCHNCPPPMSCSSLARSLAFVLSLSPFFGRSGALQFISVSLFRPCSSMQYVVSLF